MKNLQRSIPETDSYGLYINVLFPHCKVKKQIYRDKALYVCSGCIYPCMEFSD